jgi:hypothetical protein
LFFFPFFFLFCCLVFPFSANAFPGCDAANNALCLHSGGNEWLLIREPIAVAYC